MIEFKANSLFGSPFRFYGAIAAAVVAFLQTGNPIAVIFIAGMAAGASAHRGTFFDPGRGKMKRYVKVFGWAFGSWEEIVPSHGVVVLKERYSSKILGFGGQAGSDQFHMYNLFLVDESHRDKVLVGQTKDRASWEAKLATLEKDFNLKLVKYAPRVSAQTAARKRRR